MLENLKWWKLTRDLGSSKLELRKTALQELAASGDERAPELLLSTLNNDAEDVSLRRLAAETLAKQADTRIIAPVVHLLRQMDPSMAGYRPLSAALASIGAQAVKPLLELLRDEDRGLRVIVIDQLGRIADERAGPPLLPLLADGDPAVRMAAAHALGQIGDKRAIPPLLRMLADPELGPSNAAKLALRQLDWKPAGLAEFFHHFLATGHIPSSPFPAAAWEAEKVPGILLQALQKGGKAKRQRAVGLLGALGDLRAVPHLVAVLKDRNCGPTAAVVLGDLGDRRAVPHLIAALDEKEWSQLAAVALGKLGDTMALTPLQRVFSVHSEPAYDVALAQLGDPAALNRFLNLLRTDVVDKTPKAHETRRKGAEALGEIRHPAAVEPLLNALHDKKGDVRLAAVVALGKIGDARALAPLQAALREEADATEAELATERVTAEVAGEIRQRRHALRESAATALVRCSGDDAAERLALLLEDEDPEVRAVAARALGESGDVRGAKFLSDILDDEDYDVRFWAAQALAMLGDDDGVNLLMELLATTDAAPGEEKHAAYRPERQAAATRLAAAMRGVGNLAHAAALPHLVDQLGSRTADVRMAAVEAIAMILLRSAPQVPADELETLAKMDFPTIYQEPEQFLRFANVCAQIVALAKEDLARRERGDPEPDGEPRPEGEPETEGSADDLILLTCICGHENQLAMEFVGRRVMCPACHEVFEVPAPVE